MSYTCNHCSGTFCSDHRLPEAHSCSGEANFVRTQYNQGSVDKSDIQPGSPSGETISNYDDSSVLIWLFAPIALLAILVRSVLSYQRLKILLIGSLAIVAVSALFGTGFAPLDTQVNSILSTGESKLSEHVESSNTSESGTGFSPNGMNETQVEMHFVQLLNEERTEKGLPKVTRRPVLREMGHEHSVNMAQNGYLGHTEPDGTTIEDRYRERGLLPECRIESDADSYYSGAENAAQTWWQERVETNSGDTVYIDTNRGLAKRLFSQWMSSPPHKKPMMERDLNEIGLGVVVNSDGKVYASLEMC